MRLLMVEGNTRARSREVAKKGVRSASQVYVDAIHRFFPDIDIDVVSGPDGERPPRGMNYRDYAGLVMGGSGLHAYDKTSEVTNQIQLMLDFSETGKPVLGSCWGLQIAAVAAGGEVMRNEIGREIGIARKILLSDAGRQHPFFKDKPVVYDAPCIHHDEVTRLPEGSVLLSSNSHSQVQAAIVPVGNSEVWGVQYHPEFDLTQLRMLFELYGEDLIGQGFVADAADHETLLQRYRGLEENPDNPALAWQLGIDEDILDDRTRSLEIINWVEHCMAG